MTIIGQLSTVFRDSTQNIILCPRNNKGTDIPRFFGGGPSPSKRLSDLCFEVRMNTAPLSDAEYIDLCGILSRRAGLVKISLKKSDLNKKRSVNHKKGKSTCGNHIIFLVGQDYLDHAETAAHLFRSGLAVKLCAGSGAQIFHGEVGGNTLTAF